MADGNDVDDLDALVRSSLKQALANSSRDIGAALDEFGWYDFAQTDESLAFTTLFEELGYRALDTHALDLAVTAVIGRDGSEPVVWPRDARTFDGQAAFDGLLLRGGRAAGAQVLAPIGGTLRVVEVSSVDESPVGGLATDTAWVWARLSGTAGAELGPWIDVERRASLALASELVGVSHRIIDLAAEQVSARHQFGRAIGTYQAVRFRLAEAYVEMVGARALVGSAWEDGSLDSARWAKAVAGSAHDVVAKHAIQVCGAIGLSHEHPLPALVRRGFVLDALLRNPEAHPASIGRHLLDADANLVGVGGF